MFSRPEEFVFKNFQGMPLWVRVVTYFVFLLIVSFGYLSPSYIDGVAYIKIDGSEPSPGNYYKNLPFSIIKDGRKIKYTTSDEGILSIPLSTKIPTEPLEVHFYPNGVSEPPVVQHVPLKTLYSGSVTFTYFASSGQMLMASTPEINLNPLGWLVQPAYAQSESTSIADQQPEIDDESTAVTDYVLRSVSKLSGMSISQLSLQTQLGSLNLSQPKMAYLYAMLEKKYGVVVWSEIWSEATTLGDLARILYVAQITSQKRKVPQQMYSDVHKLEDLSQPLTANIDSVARVSVVGDVASGSAVEVVEEVSPVAASEPVPVAEAKSEPQVVLHKPKLKTKKPVIKDLKNNKVQSKPLAQSTKVIDPQNFKRWKKIDIKQIGKEEDDKE